MIHLSSPNLNLNLTQPHSTSNLPFVLLCVSGRAVLGLVSVSSGWQIYSAYRLNFSLCPQLPGRRPDYDIATILPPPDCGCWVLSVLSALSLLLNLILEETSSGWKPFAML
jgi:hypothetical protein